MAGLGSFFLEIGVDQTALQRGLNAAESRLTSFSKSIESAGTRISIAVSAPLGLLARKSVLAFGELEALKMSLGTLEKTTDGLNKRLTELNKVAELPGLGFKEAIQADVRLRSVGISADISKRAMLAFGNAIATAGGGKAQFDSVIYQLSQMSAKSKVLSQDFRPIIEAVPMVSAAVKKLYGTVDTEQIQSQMSKAGINSAQFINQLITELEKLPKVSGGVKNALENLEDTFFKAFAKVGETIDKNVGIQKWVEQIGKSTEELANYFSSLTPEAQKAVLAIAGIAIVLPPLLALAGTVLPAIATGFAALISPIGLAAAAITVITAAIADQYLITSKMASMTKTVAQLEDEARSQIHTQAVEIGILNDVLQDNTSTLEEKKKALEGLQKISPEYFKGLKAENLNYSDLNVSLSKYITNLENATKAQILKSKIDQNIKAESDILSNPTSQTSALDLIGAKTQQMAGRLFGNERYANSVANTVVLNAANNLTELRLTRKEYENEFAKLLKAGYGGDAPATSGNGSTGGGGTLTDAQIKAAQKIAEETLALRKDLQSQTRDLIIASMEDETQRAKSEAKKRAEDEIAAMREKMIGLKNLESEFAEWRKQREQSLANEIIKIQRESFKVPQEIKRQMVTDVMNSIEPKDKKKLTSDRMQNSLDRTIMLGAKGIQSETDRTSVGKVLGMDIDISKWQSDSASYIEAANGIVQANASIKESLMQISLSAGVAMGETVAQMMIGTATITDLANQMLSTVGGIFADMLKQLAVAQAKLILVESIFNPTALFKTIGLAAAGGLVGAFSNKVGQGRASNQQQRMPIQSQTSQLRGGDLYWSQRRYETITGF